MEWFHIHIVIQVNVKVVRIVASNQCLQLQKLINLSNTKAVIYLQIYNFANKFTTSKWEGICFLMYFLKLLTM